MANGFIEDTTKTYPEHAKRLVDSNYDPEGMKRHFSFPGTREKVYLDYINIKLPTRIQRYKMNTDEVKSLIAFCRLSSADRYALVGQRYDVLSIPEIIANVEREPRIYSKAAYKRAKKEFESLSQIS
ncbi:hypothetical protein [Pedobacter immunditicola]|uniref:hypothetical protein n=1 Tax=Pedobacter immunditicola TaxID=3133440 RepID=UPI0030A4B5A2